MVNSHLTGKKQRATTPYNPNEEWETRQAKYEQQLRDDEERYQATRERNAREAAEQQREPERERERERTRMLEHPPESPGAQEAKDALPTAVQRASAGPRGSEVDEAAAATGLSTAPRTSTATARPGAGALDRREGGAGSDESVKQSQSKPMGNVDSERPVGKCAAFHDAPVTKRSQPERGSITWTDVPESPPRAAPDRRGCRAGGM